MKSIAATCWRSPGTQAFSIDPGPVPALRGTAGTVPAPYGVPCVQGSAHVSGRIKPQTKLGWFRLNTRGIWLVFRGGPALFPLMNKRMANRRIYTQQGRLFRA